MLGVHNMSNGKKIGWRQLTTSTGSCPLDFMRGGSGRACSQLALSERSDSSTLRRKIYCMIAYLKEEPFYTVTRRDFELCCFLIYQKHRKIEKKKLKLDSN